MKKFKLLLTTLCFALMVSVLSGSVFADPLPDSYDNTDHSSDVYTFFEKPEAWGNNEIYINFINSQTGDLTFEEPGLKLHKLMDKQSIFEGIIELPEELYGLAVQSSNLNGADKVIFSSGSSASNITNKTIAADLAPFRIFSITGGEGLEQTVDTTGTFSINTVTAIQKAYRNLKQKNPELAEILETQFEDLQTSIQEILVEITAERAQSFIENAKVITDTFTKDPNSIEELKAKIAEANEKVGDEDYTEDSRTPLSQEIEIAQNIVDNESIFSQDQIDAETEELDNFIKGLVPVTTELEKAIEEAKAIDPEKYTDETVKKLYDAVEEGQNGLNNKTSLTPDKVKELTKNIKDAIAALEEKKATTESKNPATGDILAIIFPILALASVAGVFTFVYSKNKNKFII